jgi:hypothetical protein
MNTATFKVGETYTTRSICDYSCVFSFKVTKRTAKFITVEYGGKTKRVGIHTERTTGREWAMPLGRYSMAPVINATM